MAKRELIDIAGEIRGETRSAWRFYDGKTTAWVPKSQVEMERQLHGAVCTMPEWLAKEKEFI